MKEEFKVISEFIDEKSRVLDVGCGDGILMEYLSKNKVVDVRGLEISKEKVKKCLSNGLTVVEGDAENDLKQYSNQSFDYVILSQTLQAMLMPKKVLFELLRGLFLTFKYIFKDSINTEERTVVTKTALVTGAASGIGLACAKLLIEQGTRVAAFDIQGEKLLEHFPQPHKDLLTLTGDISKQEDCFGQ